jgi:tetratricopeptide (TPR) repeat protein
MRSRCVLILAACVGLARPGFCQDSGATQTQQAFETLDHRAQIEFRRDEFAKAASDFRQASEVSPAGLRACYQMYGAAAAAIAAHDFAAAEEGLASASKLQRDSPLPLAMRVKLNLVAGKIDHVKQALTDLAQRFPVDGRLHADLAQDLIHSKHYDLALAEALRFEQSGILDPHATLNLAVLENEAGAFTDSIATVIPIEQNATLPDNIRASAAAVAGLNYESLGRFGDAAVHLRLSMWLASDQERPYISLARVLETQQKNQAAIEILTEGNRRIPSSSSITLALASSLISGRHYAPAVRILEDVVSRYPNEFEAYPKLAEAYRALGQPHLATEELRRLAQRDPDYPMLHVIVAQSMLIEESVDYQGVLKELEKAEAASAADYEIYYLRGKACLALNKYDAAIASLRRAIELQPEEPGAYYQLGVAYRKCGQLERAANEFERIKFLKSQSPQP